MDKNQKKLDRFKELLGKKYDIRVDEYFLLPEDDKEELSDIILSYCEKTLSVEPRLINMYIQILRSNLNIAIHEEEYERCDIITRTMMKLEDRFGQHRKN